MIHNIIKPFKDHSELYNLLSIVKKDISIAYQIQSHLKYNLLGHAKYIIILKWKSANNPILFHILSKLKKDIKEQFNQS